MLLMSDKLNAACMVVDRASEPLTIRWPARGNLVTNFIQFSNFAKWRHFMLQFSVNDSIPNVVANKFERAQKLYILGWIDGELIKVGEMAAMTALELGLRDRFGAKMLGRLLQHLVENDGLTDEHLPIFRRYGGCIVSNLYEPDEARNERKALNKNNPNKVGPPMVLAEIRNALAHGDPFEGAEWPGLLELVRDLLNYAYRDWITESAI